MTAASGRQLLLDYGQVISTVQPEADVAELAELAGLPLAAFSRRYWAHRVRYDRGGSARAYWTDVLGGAPDDAQLARLVESTCAAGCASTPPCWTCSRACGPPGSRCRCCPMRHTSWPRRWPGAELAGFRHLLFSAELRMVKPDPRIFRAAADRLGADPGQVVFVDDRRENVDAAAAVGLRTIAYTGGAGCLDRIRRELDPVR